MTTMQKPIDPGNTNTPLVLSFDTSSAHCAAALLRGQEVLANRSEAMQRGQAERLMPLIQDMLTDQDLNWQDLDLIGVGTGPGNFTGVRLSVSAARGLALSCKIPAIGVTTFEAMAHELASPVLVALDARRDELYLQLFADTSPEPILAKADALPDWVSEAQNIVGDAAEQLATALQNTKVVTQPMPLAEAIGRIALMRASLPQPRPTPLYLRPADAKPPREQAPELIS